MKEHLEVKMLACKRCGYKWIPRKPELPVTCPKCRSPYWNYDRIYKLKKENQWKKKQDG